MLIGLHALDLAPKKAAGTAAGLTGFFGYLGGALSLVPLWALSSMHSDGMVDSSYYLHLVYNVLPCSYFKDRVSKTKASLSTNIILIKKRGCSFENASLFI